MNNLVERDVDDLAESVSAIFKERCKAIYRKRFSKMTEKLRKADELRKLNNQFQCSTYRTSRSDEVPISKAAGPSNMGPGE